MGDVQKAISRYITDYIQLNKDDIISSAKSREWFLTRIENVIASRSNEPVLYKPKFVYFGSYFKGTKVQVVDEYDVLVVIDSNTGYYYSGDVTIGSGMGVASPNHKYDDKYKKSDNTGVSPAKMLNWLRGVVKEVTDAFGGEAPERNGQAVTAIIKSQNLKIDLVPAGIFTRNSDGTTFYNIPDGSKDNSWIITSPEIDIKAINDVAKAKDNFRNIVRLAKRIKDRYNFLVPSFAIEAAIVEYGNNNKWYNLLYYDTLFVLQYLSKKFKEGKIDDPYDSNKNLISNVVSLPWYADRIDGIITVLSNCNDIQEQDIINKRVVEAFENS